MSNAQPEPSADARTFAKFLRDYYMALTLEGFSSGEALAIIGSVLASAAAGGAS